MAPAARVLAEAAVEMLGEAQAGTPGSLRIVRNPASMAKDVAAVEAAVEEVLRGA